MAISLQKGGNVNLSKEAPGLTQVLIGLGWDPRATDGAAFDLDGSAFMVKSDGEHLSIAQVAVLSDDAATVEASTKAQQSEKFRTRLLDIAAVALGAQAIRDRAHAACVTRWAGGGFPSPRLSAACGVLHDANE